MIPELDAPAHVGEGFLETGLITCFNQQPWVRYCAEPPCGQFDVTKDGVYDILEDIYRDMLDMFGNLKWFHMGGDEVKFICWEINESMTQWMKDHNYELNDSGYMKLWGYFQENALERLDKVAWEKIDKILMWTSDLTKEPYVDMYLDPNRYIIQVR